MIFLCCIISIFDYSIKAGVGFSYNDNIFEYSQKYLEEFMQQISPERFPFETYDDLVTDIKFYLLLRNKFLKNRTTTFNFGINSDNYLINQQRGYQIFETGMRQSFGKFAIKFEYLFMPRYLIRYYRDPIGNEYIGCKFTEHLLMLKCSLSLSPIISFSIILKKEDDDYIANFDMYDSEAKRIEIQGDFILGRFFEPSIDYEYKDSQAKGPVPDISYIQHVIGLNSLMRLSFPKFSKVAFGYQLKYRTYTTEVSPLIDTPHSGRLDVGNSFGGNWQFPVFTGLDFVLGYSYEFRNSYSNVYEDIGEYKNYRKWVIKSELEFQY